MSKLDDILLEELGRTRAEIQTRIITERKRASGDTGASMREVPLSPGRAGIEGFRYAGVMEKPRKPGKVPADFVQILTKWANVKGLSGRFQSQSDFDRFIYNTYQMIKARGFNPAFTKDIFTTPLENLANRLPLAIGDQFVAELINKIEWQK